MWEAIGNFANTHGLAALVFLGALCAMVAAVWFMWKRHGEDVKKITELSDKLAKSGSGADSEELEKRHDEIVQLLKVVRFAYSGDGEVMKKLNEIHNIEILLHEVHLGPNAKDDAGRLKWWGAARIEELVHDLSERYEQLLTRIEALQELRLKEGQQAGGRIDELQELRVVHSEKTVREVIEVMKAVTGTVEDIRKVVEDLRNLMRGGPQ